MCEASDWRRLSKTLCLVFYILCVFLDVHTHAQALSSNASSGEIGQPQQRLLDNLLHKYGSNGSIDLEQFEKLLNSIGLGRTDTHVGHGHAVHFHEPAHHPAAEENHSNIDKCLSAKDMYSWFYADVGQQLTEQQFIGLCPALVYMLDSHVCHHEHDEAKGKNTVDYSRFWSGDAHVLKVWGASLLAVLITSVGGVATIFLIRPLIRSMYYAVVIQFLIALAVGSLSGDALLHLLPHALFESPSTKDLNGHKHEAEGHNHEGVLYRCLTAIGGIYFFFLVERVTTMVQRRRGASKSSRMNSSNAAGATDRVLNPFHRTEDMTVTIADTVTNGHCPSTECSSACPIGTPGTENERQSELSDLMSPNATAQRGLLADSGTASAQKQQQQKQQQDSNDDEHEHTVGIKGGHHHGHSHITGNSSIRSLVWTVIIGDGLHNFCDGMAIGAGFAADIKSGISTAIAVFCHELPHELGDFAVLLQAGMSIRNAVLANVLSSVVCLFGMIFGVIMVQGSSHWVFLLTAGMFLYIALVGMMSELTNDQAVGSTSPSVVFVVQNLGFLLGVGIMFLISLYEHST